MQFRQRLTSTYYFLLLSVAFSISLPYIYSSITVILLLISWLLLFQKETFLERLKTRKMIWAWLSFFLLIAFSYFNSTDKSESAIDIQKKLSILILPICIGLGPHLNYRNIDRIFAAYLAGTMLISVFCMGRGLLHYFSSGELEQLFYHSLVSGLNANAVYYASYAIFALSILLLHDFTVSFLKKNVIRYIFICITLLFFILLSSRSLLVLFIAFILPLYFLRGKVKGKINWTLATIVVVMTLGTFSVVTFTKNPIKNRYEEISKNNTLISESTTEKGKAQVFNNFTLRIFLWKMAWSNIKEHDLWLTGCGNGDVATLQRDRIAAYDEKTNALYNQPDLSMFNLHNMYLQVLMTIGIPGLLLFLIIVFQPLRFLRNIQSRSVFLTFIVTYSLFMMQESALQTQAGVIYFTFFSQILLGYYYAGKEKKDYLARARTSS